jgi:demethylspheroidene O-methyltransferase
MSYETDNRTLKTRWVMRRNAILGSASFQRWAARVPLFRSISRRYAAAQFDLVAGFVYSQILLAFVETGLLEYLNGELRPVEDIAEKTRLGGEATLRLLKAAQALELAESPQMGLWTLGKAGAPLSANPGAIAMIRHHHLLYKDLTDPVRLLADNRDTQTVLSSYWTYASREKDGGDTAGYSALMSATQPMVSEQILDAYDFSQHRRMLDIGGGSGAFVSAVAKAAPTLTLGIFDLPDVIAEARQRVAGDSTIEFHPGSFKESQLPSGFDLITLVRICHDHDDDVVQALLGKIHAVLPSGGKLLIVEPMAESKSGARMGDAYFGFYLWAMGSGRPRSAQTLIQMLVKAGFSFSKAIPTNLPIITSAIIASK